MKTHLTNQVVTIIREDFWVALIKAKKKIGAKYDLNSDTFFYDNRIFDELEKELFKINQQTLTQGSI